MQAVILAAGKGTRLRPFTVKNPKPLLKLSKDKRILEHTLDNLPKKIDEVILVVNYKKEKIKKKYGDNYNGIKLKYVYHKELDGTAKALWLCRKQLKEEFILLHGDDIYPKKDLEELIKNGLGVLATKREGKPSGGHIIIDENKNLAEIEDYPKTVLDNYLLNTGAYKLNKKIFNYKPVLINRDSKEYGLPQTLAILAKDYPVRVVTIKQDGYFQINSKDEYKLARKYFND